MTTTHTTPHLNPRADRAARRRTRAVTVLVAMVAALLGWVALDPLAGVELTVRTADDGAVQAVGPDAAMVAALASGLAGWALLALLERCSAKARSIWTVTAGLVLLVSLLGTSAATSASATAALASLHILVGGVLIMGLRRRP